ncbi:MAG: hypothetical protein HY248_05810 [Fimbriimonas ginsengisoli]|uniref:Uncharacterized protein n=1 Tax=Fimbriimonas ginsengisoli TaxID=1005039 RepID=A0A931PVA5_FIMGI|nr:hypothetical protein [Fimbriimonas ginsengisoli]MBI3722051.1 hypothetical protein [Fimbriimonas ginsengisoli]
MKKVLTILTVLAAFGVLLAGCGGGSDTTAPADKGAKAGADAKAPGG